ncbi:MAG TPA: hypothetical protein VK063_13915 [Beutenbergiaceae bacterium]|nr:hypothetical protein [Beutenbergiaceae bacterium]
MSGWAQLPGTAVVHVTLEIAEDVSRYTKAAFLQPGKETDMLARFFAHRAGLIGQGRSD